MKKAQRDAEIVRRLEALIESGELRNHDVGHIYGPAAYTVEVLRERVLAPAPAPAPAPAKSE